LRVRVSGIRPVLRDTAWRGRLVSRVPVAFRLSGVGFLGHPVPAEELASLPVGLPATHTSGRCPDLGGVSTFRLRELRPGWTPPWPRSRWCSCGRSLLSGRHLPRRSGQPCTPAVRPISRGST